MPGSDDTVLSLDPAGQFAPPVRACGTERWAVKTAADPAAVRIQPLDQARPTDVQTLVTAPAPKRLTSARIEPQETQVWTVDVLVVKAKLEGDRDYHLVIADDAGRTMIAEVPDPACVSPVNRFYPQMQQVRDAISRAGPVTAAGFTPIGRHARLTGVAFFDNLHGQTGVAINGAELHPVLRIEWIP